MNELDMTGWTDKDSRNPEYRALYENHDYLTAYSLHTDMRVEKDPKWAIGRGDEWELHGDLQLAFLKDLGLLPKHTLLDIGCGVGRAARKFVPYLDTGNYVGVDISEKALAHAQQLAKSEQWAVKEPTFLRNSDLDFDRKFDFLWAHSVFTHLPDWQIEKMVANIVKIMREAFAFTFKRRDRPIRTGLKQFGYDEAYFYDLAQKNGLIALAHDHVWPAGQKTFVFTHG